MSDPLISLQLYSIRDAIGDDFAGALAKVADLGFEGVEPAGGFRGMSPAEFRRTVEDLGMQVVGTHTPWCTPDSLDEAVATAEALGLDVVGGGYGPDRFEDRTAIDALAAEINGMLERLQGTGKRLYVHNHAWEYERIDGELKAQILADACPELQFEIDTYWACNFGAEDAAAHVTHFADRTPLLHIKDGTLVKGEANLAVGTGKVDVPSILAAGKAANVRAFIVEFDRCDTDIWDACAASAAYLKAQR